MPRHSRQKYGIKFESCLSFFTHTSRECAGLHRQDVPAVRIDVPGVTSVTSDEKFCPKRSLVTKVLSKEGITINNNNLYYQILDRKKPRTSSCEVLCIILFKTYIILDRKKPRTSSCEVPLYYSVQDVYSLEKKFVMTRFAGDTPENKGSLMMFASVMGEYVFVK
jgi:hypothetical protein